MKKNNYAIRALIILIIIVIGHCWVHASCNIDFALVFSKDITNGGFYIGDINNDGLNELAISGSKKVNIYRFSQRNLSLLGEIPLNENPIAILIADPDKDDRKEILIGTRSGDLSYVYVGEFSNGQFNLEWKSPLVSSIRYPTELAVGDVNGNDKNEIIIGVSWFGRYLVSYEFNDLGYTKIFQDNIGSDVDSVCVSDVNGDGREELIVATSCWSDYSLRVYDNYVLSDSDKLNGRSAVSVLDINDDGIDEIVTAAGTVCNYGVTYQIPVIKIYKYNNFLEELFAAELISDTDTYGRAHHLYVSAGKLNSEKYCVSGAYVSSQGCDIIKLFSKELKEVWSYNLNPETDESSRETLWHFQFADIDNNNHNKLIATTNKRLLIFVPIDPCQADFDIDGDIDGSDLAIFANNFGRTDCIIH